MKSTTDLSSDLSTRTRILREANRRGRWFGVISRAGKPLGRAEALLLARDSVQGLDIYQHFAVPERWHKIFVREFVKAAVRAAHTKRDFNVARR